MSQDITIPPAALEAAARALREEVRRALNVEEPDPPEGASPSLMEAYRSEARAAALALLENWPGMRHRPEVPALHASPSWPGAIILPITTETANDKA